MSGEDERLKILELIDSGQISVEDGLKLLEALDSAPEEEAAGGLADPLPEVLPAVEVIDPDGLPGKDEAGGAEGGEEYFRPQETAMPSEVERWKRWWRLPLFAGVALSVMGALLMFFAWRAWELSFWFACSWVPFLIGVAVIVVAAASSRMRWLHLRVTQPEGARPRRIAISMPLPVRFIAFILRFAGRYTDAVRDQHIDQMLLALENLGPDQPLHIETGDEDGEHVEIFIG